MLAERKDHTLSVNGLVHEAYLRLFPGNSDYHGADYKNRDHFYRLFSRAMKRTLIDHARNRNAFKRKSRKYRQPIQVALQVAGTSDEPATEMKQAIECLALVDQRLAQVIEMRYYSQLTVQEIADRFEVSTRTIDRDLKRARLLLFRALANEHLPPPALDRPRLDIPEPDVR
jgi:RNA polymerase sigma factor (TIGR02999 family)